MRTLLKIVVAVLLILLIAVGVLLFTDFNSPRLTQALIDLAAGRAGVELEVESAALNLRRGLQLEGVRARSEGQGERLTVSLDRLLLEHRLWPLLRGDIVVDRLVLESPRIDMVSAPPPEPGTRPASTTTSEAGSESMTPEEEGDRLRLEVAEVRIEDGYLSSTVSGAPGSTVIEGLDLTFRDVAVDPDEPQLALAVSGRGWLEADSLALDERVLNGIATSFEAERGRLRLAEFETSTAAGDLRVEEIEVDLAQDPYRYRVAIEADRIDLNLILGLSGGLGPARLELRGNGEGPGLAGAVAEMGLWLDEGTLPSVAVLSRVDRLFGTSFDGAAYQAIDLRLSLAEDVLEVDPVDLVTEIAALQVAGTLEIGGAIDLKVAVGVPRDLFTNPGISEGVLDALTRQDWLTIPLRVSGTVNDPRFGPDLEVVRERTRYMAEQARDSVRSRFESEVTSAVGRLLGR